MNKTILISILACVLLISIGCGIPAYQPDSFYSAWVDWDGPRFPLIKPYDVFFLGQEERWVISLHSSLTSDQMEYYLNIYDVEKIAVTNGVIMVYTPYVQDENDEQKAFYWFAIIPDKDIEKGFDNEFDFLEYVKEYGIEDIVWRSPEELNRKFLETGCLEWIPDCK